MLTKEQRNKQLIINIIELDQHQKSYKIQRIGSVRASNLTEIYKEPEEGLSPVFGDETMEC